MQSSQGRKSLWCVQTFSLVQYSSSPVPHLYRLPSHTCLVWGQPFAQVLMRRRRRELTALLHGMKPHKESQNSGEGKAKELDQRCGVHVHKEPSFVGFIVSYSFLRRKDWGVVEGKDCRSKTRKFSNPELKDSSFFLISRGKKTTSKWRFCSMLNGHFSVN